MLLWYHALAYLALRREANLTLSNGKVTALPTAFNPVVKLARAEAYRQERAASSTKLFPRQSSKQLLSGENAYGVLNASKLMATYSQLQEASTKGGGRKKGKRAAGSAGGCPSLHSHETRWARNASCSPLSRAYHEEDKAFQREFAAAPCCFPLHTEQF